MLIHSISFQRSIGRQWQENRPLRWRSSVAKQELLARNYRISLWNEMLLDRD